MAARSTGNHSPMREMVTAVFAYRSAISEEMMQERGLSVDHTTVYRWVQHYAPEKRKTMPFAFEADK